MSSEQLLSRQRQSQRAFYRALASGSAEARLVELDGVQATLVPAREWFSIFNSVFYDQPDALERHHATLATAYSEAGVKAWTVWVPPGDRQAPRVLERLGHRLDSSPMLFAASIESLDLDPVTVLVLDPEPRWQVVAEINDRAHGVLEPWSMAAVFETMSDPDSHLHIALHDETPASALIAREHDGDCYLWFVATVPEARGRGIASELMRHALRQARERGCTTTTLESTEMAETMYERLGYTPLCRYEMWESRAG
jgi:GNAT superfamily N-acetyltransferase